MDNPLNDLVILQEVITNIFKGTRVSKKGYEPLIFMTLNDPYA